MNRKVGLGILFSCICYSVFAQVDTSYVYNTSMPYGTLDLRISKSSTRYYYLQEDVTFSFRESIPGVRSTTYRDMTSWDSSPYKQGNLREKNGGLDQFVMNYRILFPNGYDPTYDPGYPIIIMLHGAGEGGNCWNSNCYWATPAWNPNSNSPAAPSTEYELLNNDRNLFHGGAQHLNAVKAAGTMLPNNPDLPSRAFPGIVLFPQALNGWSQPSKVEDAIRLLRLVIRKYNIDENRVYIHGLSNGGGGVNQALKRAPWLFAGALGMSAVSDGEIVMHNMLGEVAKLPLWYFQGGQDTNPTPSKTFNFVKKIRDAGGVVRYYLYPALGHGTWNSAYKEPDFFSWILDKKKYNPHISYGNPVICNTTGAGVRLSYSNGFLAYQWEKDGVIIPGETGSEFVANTPGVYRGRFSRKSSAPGEGEWEPWSDPVTVSEVEPAKPSVIVTGTTHLRGPGLAGTEANNRITLTSGSTADLYEWYKNGQLVNFNFTDIDDTLKSASFSSSNALANGAYSLVIKNSYCPSPPSDPVYIFFNNSAPQNLVLNPATTNLQAVPNSSSIFFSWNDQLNNETGYELWRRKTGTTDFVFAGKTAKDAISFTDKGLEPGTTYEYKLRAVNNSGRSNYVPSDALATNFIITTLSDTKQPAPPQNVRVVSNSVDYIKLMWDPASDENSVKQYRIRYGTAEVYVPGTQTTFTLSSLPANTLFPITIEAQDFAGHWSQPSGQIIGSTYVLSLNYKHSTGAWTDLDDTTLTITFINPEFTGTVNNFSLTPRTQEDFYNFQFTGFLNLAMDGKYVFRTTSDDGSRLLIDGVTVVDNDGKHGNKTITGDTISLSAGLHAIEVQYFDNNGFQNLVVQYAGPGIGDGATFVSIPDEALKSGVYTPPSLPGPPTNPMAMGIGMQQIAVSWEYGPEDETTDYEIFRAETANGPFRMAGRSATLTFTDSVQLLPGKSYYYQVRTVNSNGSSGFSAVASATTHSDTQAPGAPTGLKLLSKTYTSIAISWNASADNIGVKEYEVYANGILLGKSNINSFTATNLTGITYTFTVKAIDATGNVSESSAALVVDNTIAGMFYSLATGNLNNLSTWRKNADGTGQSPTAFGSDGQTFVIRNRTVTGLGGDWSVTGAGSVIIVPDGATLNIDGTCLCTIELQGNSTLNLNEPTAPALVNISETSTVNFNAPSVVAKNRYGNIRLSGTGEKVFSGDSTFIAGNLVVGSGLKLSGNGAVANLKISKNLLFEDPAEAGLHNVHLIFTSDVLHTIQSNNSLALFKITGKSNSNITFSSNKIVELRLGTTSGGGLSLAAGSRLTLNDNHLYLTGSGSLNPNGGTGQISIEGGDITLNSTAASAMNLYFAENHATIGSLQLNLPGAVFIHNPVGIRDEIVIKSGILNSNGNITLLSDSEHSAFIPRIENGQINGAVTVQRYLPLSGKIWRDLSVAVSDVTVSDLQDYFPVTGDFTGTSTGPGLTSDPSLFVSGVLKQALVPYPAKSQTNNAPIEKAKGYAAYMHSLNDSTATTLSTTGNLFQGNIAFSLKPGDGSARQGWNLIGNPYPSPITWDQSNGWIKNGISNTIVVRNSFVEDSTTVSHYQYYNSHLGSPLIGQGEAFWVHAINAQPALTITEFAKATEAPAQPVGKQYLVVNLENGVHRDPAYIFMASDATSSYDGWLDVPKFQNEGMFSLSSDSDDGIDLAINYINNNFTCANRVPLNLLNTTRGNYTFTFENTEALASAGQVSLVDNLRGITVPVSNGPYSFAIDGDITSVAGRFELVFSSMVVDFETPTVEVTEACKDTNAVISIRSSQSGVEYAVLNDKASVISNIVTGNGSVIALEVPYAKLHEGLNSLRIQAGFPGCITLQFPQEFELQYLGDFEVQVSQDMTGCTGVPVAIKASGTPRGGKYRWFDSAQQPIAHAQDSILTVDVAGDTKYFVEAVSANGCTSARKAINIQAVFIEKPVITIENDTLYSSTDGPYQWKKDGLPIDGETKQYLVPGDSASYSVEVSNGVCVIASEPVTFKPGSVIGTNPDPVVGNAPDLPSSFVVDIYPIPSDGSELNVMVRSFANDEVRIRVISSSGQMKFDRSIPSSSMREGLNLFDSGQLQNGLYIVVVTQGINEVRRKVVIRR